MSPEPFAFKGFPFATNTMTQSLPSRSNQEKFFKSSTVLQSSGTVVHDKNGSGKMTAKWQNTF